MRKFFLVFIIFSLIALSPEAQEADQGFFKKINWFIDFSVLLFPENNGMGSDPMPVLPSPGAGLSYPITNIFWLELTLDFYMTHYRYNYTLDMAVPAAIENRSARVMGSFLGFHAAAYFNVNSFMTVRVYGGPAADLRIIFIAAGLNDSDKADAKKQTDSVRRYFWSQGRWFMPVIGTGLDFSVSQRFRLGIDLRVWVPIYRLWTGEKLPGIEGWRFGPGIRLSFI